MKRYIYTLMCVAVFFISACTDFAEMDNILSEKSETRAVNLKTKEFVLQESGKLAEKLGEEAATVEKLILSGSIDADDVNTFRNKMPKLVSLDIKDVKFVESEKKYNTDWGGYAVKSKMITEHMFARLKLTELVIPEYVEVIGYEAFLDTPVETVDLSDNVKNLERSAFKGCFKLLNITVPKNMISIENYTFEGCSSLKSVILPEELVSIGHSAFSGCVSLSAIDVPKTVTVIDNSAFSRTGLKSVVIPEGVTVLSEGMFDGCRSLENVQLPNTLTDMLGAAFRNCISLKMIDIPSHVTVLGNGIFSGCTSLQSITLPDGIKKLEIYTFSGCTSLKKIKLSSNLEMIDNEVFRSCSSLRTIDIPESVKVIGDGCFAGCPSLTSIFLKGKTTLYNIFSAASNCLIYVSDENSNISVAIKNVIINGVASTLTLTDRLAFFCPKEFKAQKIIYTKTFNSSWKEYPIPGKAAGWVGLSLPFSVTNITHADGRILAPFGSDVEGAKPFWLRKLTVNGFENTTRIEAGVPYIMAMPHNEKYAAEYNIEGVVTFSAENMKDGITIPVTSYQKQEGTLYDMVSSYESQIKSISKYILNTYDYVAEYNCGSVFVKSLRDSYPFESYVIDKAFPTQSTAMFNISNAVRTRNICTVGSKPSIDDM